MASSIRVAEAAKVIENTQRDLNIAGRRINDRMGASSVLWAETKIEMELTGLDGYHVTQLNQGRLQS